MTKDVLISVTGLQMLSSDEEIQPIEVVTVGEYYFRNGHHFLKYEEAMEGFSEMTLNYIKADDKAMEVRKKGVTNVHMVFEEQKKNVTYYRTPFGDIQMGIAATKITCSETEENIDIHVDYALEMNEEHVADCYIKINVKPKNSRDFSLRN